MLRAYRTNDGELFAAETPAELVRRMHKASRSPAANDGEFMREVAGRIEALGGKPVRTDSAAGFIADLLATGHLIEEGLK